MNPYIDILNEHTSKHCPNQGCLNFGSFLDTLYCCYTQRSQVDPSAIRACFAELDDILSPLSLEDNNRVFFLTYQISAGYQKQAFHDGLLIGFSLYQELTKT